MVISFKRDAQGVLYFFVELEFQGAKYVGKGLTVRAARHQARLAAAEGF
jgi:hypothetical protein